MKTPRKLGKKHVKTDGRTFRAHHYYDVNKLGPTPLLIDYMGDRDYPMFKNDSVGDCTIASRCHAAIAQTATSDGEHRARSFTDSQVIQAYSEISGYDPDTGANDDGCCMLDVLKHQQKHGIGGDYIGAYAVVQTREELGTGQVPLDWEKLLRSLQVYQGVWIGIALPAAVWELGNIWRCPKLPSQRGGKWLPGSAGGHGVTVLKADSCDGSLGLPSWHERITMDFEFAEAYVDEIYVTVSEDQTNDLGVTPLGLNLQQLVRDAEAIAGNKAA